MTSRSWISWLGALLIAFSLTIGALVPTVRAVGDARKVSVVSFGLFGDQRVFRSEATGAAQVVASRFGAVRSTCNTIQRMAAVRRSKLSPCHCKGLPME